MTPVPELRPAPTGSDGARTRSTLASLRTNIRSATLADGLSALVTGVAIFAVSSYGADRLFELERIVRVVFLFVALLWIGRRLQRRLFRPFLTRLADEELALALERQGAHEQRVISTVQFAQILGEGRPNDRGESEPLMRAVIDETEARAAELAKTTAVDSGRVARAVGTVVLLCAVLATLAARFPEEASLWARRNLLFESTEWPRETTLFFVGAEGGVLRVPAGVDVTLTARADGVIPESVRFEVVFEDDSEVEVSAGRTPDGIFRGTLRAPVLDARIIARGGDGRSEPIELQLLRRPELTEFLVETTLPDYLGKTEAVKAPLGTAQVVRGGSVQISVQTDKPLASLVAIEEDEPEAGPDGRIQRFEQEAEAGADGRSAFLSFRPDRDLNLVFQLVDTEGVEPLTSPSLTIQVVDDAPPVVGFTPKGIGPAIVSDARIPGQLTLSDDQGVRSIDFGATVSTRPADDPAGDPIERQLHVAAEGERPLIAQGTGLLEVDSTESDLDVVVDLIDLPEAARPQPGATLRLTFSAQDARPDATGRGTAEPRAFRIVTRDELIEELDRRQSQLRREVESVLTETVELASVTADLKVEEPASANRPARRAPALAERCRGIAGRFRDILDELSNNRLLEQRDVDRLDQNVVRALGGIASGPFQRAAAALSSFGENPSNDLRTTAQEQLDRAQSDLRAVLARMKDGEGLARLVEILRSVLRTTERVENETEAARRRQAASDIFGTKPSGGQPNGGKDR